MSGEMIEILLVDDNEDHVELIRRAFMDDGKKVSFTIANTLAKAQALVQESTPELMIVDFRLPDGEGIALLPGSIEAQTIPVIMLTGQGDENIATAAIKAGALDYIVKSSKSFLAMPRIVERTLREWEHIIERRRAEDKLRRIARLGARTAGVDFFAELAESVAEVLGVKVAFVAEFIATNPVSARSVVLWIDDSHAEKMQWPLSGTPCEQVANGEEVFIAKGVQAAFPDDLWLSEVGIESYFAIPLSDSHGQVMGHIGIMDNKPIRDRQEIIDFLNIFSGRVSAELERKRMQDHLQLSQYMIDHSSDAAFWIDQDGSFVNVNETACNSLGYTREALLTMSVFDISPELPHDGWLEHWQEIKKRGSFHLESIHQKCSGERFPVDISVNYVSFQGEEFNFAFATDISARKHADEALVKLSSAIEQAGESVVITDKNGVIEYVNPRFTTLTGYSAEEAIGQTPRLLKSGNQDAIFYEKMWKTISQGDIWHGKIIDRKKDGSFYPATLTISPVHTQGGDAASHTHYVGIQSDLSKIEDLEQQFHQAQKMEAIGTLVGGIAHDFNNILAGMTGNLYLARKRIQDMPEVIQKLDNVEELSMRAADMIQQLLTFARKGRISIKPIPFTPFIKETLKLLRASVPENIALHEEICSAALQVKGDSTLLHQVLMNLITNARDAVEGVEQPCITVGLECFHANESFAHNRADFKAGAYAHLSVEDNGCGIPKNKIEHLFEPFFTTKEQGKGTGLGLAMVFGAVKTHEGFVEVDSIMGKGSIFHIYLPLLERNGAASKADKDKEAFEPGHGELILFADDQPQVLETGEEVLESLGYKA
jgi:PAS domain S-box-containing protein